MLVGTLGRDRRGVKRRRLRVDCAVVHAARLVAHLFSPYSHRRMLWPPPALQAYKANLPASCAELNAKHYAKESLDVFVKKRRYDYEKYGKVPPNTEHTRSAA